MAARVLAGFLGGACLLGVSIAHAACTMDHDCGGDLVCEDGQCVATPLPLPPPAPPTPVATPAATPPASAPARSLANEPTHAEERRDTDERRPAKGKRHSKAMMAVGIVMTSFSGVSLLVMGVGIVSSNSEAFVGGFLATGVLAGVGIPLMVIGGRRERVRGSGGEAVLSPWLTPHAGGASLRLTW